MQNGVANFIESLFFDVNILNSDTKDQRADI